MKINNIICICKFIGTDASISRHIAFLSLVSVYLLSLLCTIDLANAETGYVTDHLVSEWNWTDDSGNTIVDPVSGNNGVNHGSVLYTLPDGTLARRFNGTGAYIDCGNSTSLEIGNNDFTIDTMIMFNNATSLESIAGKLTFVNQTWGLGKNGSDVFIQVRGAGGTTGVEGKKLLPGTWYHVTATRLNGMIALYINGTKQGASVQNQGNPATAALPFRIGARSNAPDYFFDGSIQYVRYYNIGFNDSMVLQNFDPVHYGLQNQINMNAKKGAQTIVTKDYDGGPLGYTYYLPDNTNLNGGNHMFRNISFVVRDSSNVTVKGIINDGSSLSNMTPFVVSGTCDKIRFASCLVNDNRNSRSGAFLIFPKRAISNISIVDCNVSDTDYFGYEILTPANITSANVTDLYFYNDTAIYCGYYARTNDFCVGFDMNEHQTNNTTYALKNALIRNCTAAFCWESGFHEEALGFMDNVTFDGCTSHDNAQKPSPTYGAGFLVHGSNLINCISYNNRYGCRAYNFTAATVNSSKHGMATGDTPGGIFSGNNITNNDYGISLTNYSSATISGNAVNGNYEGVRIDISSGIDVHGNAVDNNSVYGIVLNSSNNNTVYNNFAQYNGHHGIIIFNSTGNSVTGNAATGNEFGIYCNGSMNNISGNTANSNSYDGIYFYGADNNIASANTVSNNYYGIILYVSENNSITANTANDEYTGIGLGKSDNNNMTGNTMNNTSYGISAIDMQGSVFPGNTITNSGYGIYAKNSTGSVFSGNNLTNNGYGIYLMNDSNAIISGNVLNYNYEGVRIDVSNINYIRGNTINNNSVYGINLNSSNNNTVYNNFMQYNGHHGIIIFNSTGNSVTGNAATGNEFGIYCNGSMNSISGNTASNNSYDGIYFYGADNNIASANTVSNNYYGIILYVSENNSITANTANDEYTGIYLGKSDNNIVTRNTMNGNVRGAWLSNSSDNILWLNHLNNTRNAVAQNTDTNYWNTTVPVQYSYNGLSYTNYTGNYYSDYHGVDSNGDGIGDTAYVINPNNIDYYPTIF